MKPVRFMLLGCAIALAGVSVASADDEASWGAGTVARATFTNGVADREPLDSITEAANDSRTIYFFSELRNLSGETITHRWEHDGQVMAEIPFYVGGSRWRVWSSKNLEPSWVGEWKVSVTRSDGTVLESKRFHYADSSTVPANPAE